MYDSNNNDAVALLFIIVDQTVVWAHMHICVCVVLAKAGCVCEKNVCVERSVIFCLDLKIQLLFSTIHQFHQLLPRFA